MDNVYGERGKKTNDKISHLIWYSVYMPHCKMLENMPPRVRDQQNVDSEMLYMQAFTMRTRTHWHRVYYSRTRWWNYWIIRFLQSECGMPFACRFVCAPKWIRHNFILAHRRSSTIPSFHERTHNFEENFAHAQRIDHNRNQPYDINRAMWPQKRKKKKTQWKFFRFAVLM